MIHITKGNGPSHLFDNSIVYTNKEDILLYLFIDTIIIIYCIVLTFVIVVHYLTWVRNMSLNVTLF